MKFLENCFVHFIFFAVHIAVAFAFFPLLLLTIAVHYAMFMKETPAAPGPTVPCEHCGGKRVFGAAVCKHCGRDVNAATYAKESKIAALVEKDKPEKCSVCDTYAKHLSSDGECWICIKKRHEMAE